MKGGEINMKKVIMLVLVAAFFLSATAVFAATPVLDTNPGSPQAIDSGNLVAYWSSYFIHNGGNFGSGDPSYGTRGAEIQSLLGH